MHAREHLIGDSVGFTRLPDGRVRVRVLTAPDRLTLRGVTFSADEWAELTRLLIADAQAAAL